MKTLITRLITLFALTSLVIKLPAQIAPLLGIQPAATNTVTVSVNGIGARIHYVYLQASTNLTAAKWINVQTNFYIGAGAVTFTNIPATNASEFFRVETTQ